MPASHLNTMAIFHETLPNGLRLVHVQNHARVGWCGLAVNAGSRDDFPCRQGLAHFVEHTIFKGTTHRRAWHILNRMETVGGELNAYTTKEGTMLYSVFPSQHVERAIELMSDLVTCSVFPEAELEREKDVVLEEVASYRDTPSEAIFDDLEDIAFAGHGMGHNILGSEQHIARMTSADCQRYLKMQYVPANMAFFSLGPCSPGKIFGLAAKHFGAMHHALQRPQRVPPAILAPEHREVDIDVHQCHTVVAARVPGMYDEGRFALTLLNNMLGGPGMNSLLNVRLRERQGLVYTVESSIASFTDCGLFEIYFGCERNKVSRSLGHVFRTIDELAQSALPAHRLDACKRQYCGQMLVASSNPEAVAMRAGKSLLFWNEVTEVQDSIDRILQVTPEQLRMAAERLTRDHATILTFH